MIRNDKARLPARPAAGGRARPMRVWTTLLIVLSCGLGACAAEKTCAPGSTQQCFCTDGGRGAQSCAGDGKRWEACTCSAASPASPGQQSQVVLGVELHSNGDILVDGKRLPDDEAVLPIAKAAYAKNNELRAVIRADTAAGHQRVLRVLDLLKQAGITKIAFASSGVPEPSGGPTAAPVEVKP